MELPISLVPANIFISCIMMLLVTDDRESGCGVLCVLMTVVTPDSLKLY